MLLCLLRLKLLVLPLLGPHFRLCLSVFFWISWDRMYESQPHLPTRQVGSPGTLSLGSIKLDHATQGHSEYK